MKRSLRGERTPLLVAGLEYLCPIYRKANTYPALLDTWVDAHAESMSAQDLHLAAWKIVAPAFGKTLSEKAESFRTSQAALDGIPFSPDNDGVNDELTIGLKVDDPVSVGVGASTPVVPFSDLDNRWKNRRVEFIMVRE